MTIRLEVPHGDVAPMLIGLLLATIRLGYEALCNSTGLNSALADAPGSVHLELAGMAVDTVVRSMPSGVRERLVEQRDELAAHVVGAQVVHG